MPSLQVGARGSAVGLEGGNESRSRFPGRREELAARAFGKHSETFCICKHDVARNRTELL